MKTHLVFLLAVTVAMLGMVKSLRYQDFEEGVCLRYKPEPNFNETWFATASLPYVTAGSRYHLYRMTSSYSKMPLLREFEFLYDSCIQSYANITTREGRLTGFGGEFSASYDLLPTNRKGVLDFVPLPTPGLADVSRHTVTLTDNKSFVFFANCWRGTNQRGFDVVSMTPTLDARTQQLIEDHAVSLGFDREHFLFLRHDHCSNERDSSDPGMLRNSEGSSISAGWRARASNWFGGRYSGGYV